MKKPVVEELTNKEAMARVGDAELVYRETYSIGADDKGNLIDKRYYKKKATNKSKTYTPQLEEIANKYGLDLDDAWNV